ncbi:hypothetical protein LVD17_05525 [Fulvivirga ulvae]|uniref:hypothetical protein n=1 Tax=Fulvivirga ulvae TaxID=2904245 RepID=UPI001F3DBAEF|nr:hypothetical protein [Fulvivirga ulvae]UII33283.1 hypothetical protein LVD17_05525 [Fulvivirga ulvae]
MTTFRSEIFFETGENTDKLKEKIRFTYEAGDMLKHDEFRPFAKNYTTTQLKGLRRMSINDPNLHYIGNYVEGNFNLRSPRFLFWYRVTLFVFPRPHGAKVSLELKSFWLIFVPLIVLNLIGLLLLVMEGSAGLAILIFSMPLMTLFIIKQNNTIKYFRGKLCNKN